MMLVKDIAGCVSQAGPSCTGADLGGWVLAPTEPLCCSLPPANATRGPENRGVFLGERVDGHGGRFGREIGTVGVAAHGLARRLDGCTFSKTVGHGAWAINLWRCPRPGWVLNFL